MRITHNTLFYGLRIWWKPRLESSHALRVLKDPRALIMAIGHDGETVVSIHVSRIPPASADLSWANEGLTLWYHFESPVRSGEVSRWVWPEEVTALDVLLHPEGGERTSIIRNGA